MRVSVIGTGYVGLVTGACLAAVGHDVVAMDDNPAKIAVLREGRLPIYEPHLAELVAQTTRAGRLRFTTDVAAAAQGVAVSFICVNTPPRPDGDADLRYVEGRPAGSPSTPPGTSSSSRSPPCRSRPASGSRRPWPSTPRGRG